jgi:hypothetical protein
VVGGATSRGLTSGVGGGGLTRADGKPGARVGELGEDELLAPPPRSLEVDVVDDEVSEGQSRVVVHHLVLGPASPFVEYDVTGDVDVLC